MDIYIYGSLVEQWADGSLRTAPFPQSCVLHGHMTLHIDKGNTKAAKALRQTGLKGPHCANMPQLK